ncbi:MAG TPA: sigma-70 family RNA polymerase sigma factor [Acidobacteriota bacterium]|nr:sigma-70 family RNA polymerase sigma factor [Acidobacteriota bacterium]HRV08407.1 sigma-70 family RNA polymerase sigma factor [Acidobacteriota bacterium]
MDTIDRDLVGRAMAGDTECFGRLVERWQARIYAFVRRYLGDSEEARDVTQNTFTKAFLRLAQLQDPDRFNSWLHMIAVNECRMRQRWGRVRPETSWEETGTVLESRMEERVTPLRALEAKERLRCCELAFRRLPPEQQEVILMKELQGLRLHEIAAILDVPLSTVKSRLYAGLKSLRRLMGEYSDEM